MRDDFARRGLLERAVATAPFGRPVGAMPIGVVVVTRAPSPPALRRQRLRQAAPTTAEELREREWPRSPAVRALLPEPGVWRIVRWGEFRPTLTPQIAHPERLHDGHRLSCYAQVYEVTRPEHAAAVAVTIVGSDQPRQLLRLTPPLAARLALVPLLSPGRKQVDGGRDSRELVMPDERLVRLRVASDPTRLATDSPNVAAAAPDAGPASAPSGPRTEIPERFVKPWEFRLSREEAVYDMHAAMPRFPVVARLLDRLTGARGRRNDIAKWHALLAGKSHDEQLWAVRPPHGGLARAAVRDWAARVLEAAGYDARAMLSEWEIFWRRKGS